MTFWRRFTRFRACFTICMTFTVFASLATIDSISCNALNWKEAELRSFRKRLNFCTLWALWSMIARHFWQATEAREMRNTEQLGIKIWSTFKNFLLTRRTDRRSRTRNFCWSPSRPCCRRSQWKSASSSERATPWACWPGCGRWRRSQCCSFWCDVLLETSVDENIGFSVIWSPRFLYWVVLKKPPAFGNWFRAWNSVSFLTRIKRYTKDPWWFSHEWRLANLLCLQLL